MAFVLGGVVAPAQAMPSLERGCFEPAEYAGARVAGDDQRGADHRDISAAEQRAIEKRTRNVLAAKGTTSAWAGAEFSGASVPVYVHVMRDKAGNGDVTDTQISQQIAVLNKTFGGQESSSASNTGFTFTLAGVDRFNNDQWHADRKSTQYRAATRQGGADALNIWLVDFSYLGIATFPWDYARNPSIDGIRCTTPAARRQHRQLQPRRDRDPRGGPLVRALPHVPGRLHLHERRGLRHPGAGQLDQRLPRGPRLVLAARARPDPQLHGLRYDSCYTEFTGGQTSRMGTMWTAYRG